MNICSEHINRIISEKGVKKQAVADRAGIPRKSFSAMLHDRKIITAEDIVKIALALDVTPNEILGVS